MNELFAYVRKNRSDILNKYKNPVDFCRALISGDTAEYLPQKISDQFLSSEPDERDYAIASAYSLLIGETRRRELSAYFTPPILTNAVLRASANILEKTKYPTVLDPACGGGSFLTPVARHLIKRNIECGTPAEDACREVVKNVHGIEVDTGLATLSQALLRNALACEYGVKVEKKQTNIRCADALHEVLNNEYDLVVGNPPFGKIGRNRAAELLTRDGPANIGGHTNLYALFLLRSLKWLKPGGGLVFVLPTSFVAGPYFASLRKEVLRQAEVVRIDLHEQRENLFLGAVQDICVLTLRRRKTSAASGATNDQSYQLGVIDSQGILRSVGTAVARGNGEPWTLPLAHEIRPFVAKPAIGQTSEAGHFTLADYGYRVRVGKVVPTRERKQLHGTPQSGDLPLLWASTIRPDGSFDFTAPDRFGNARWYSPPDRETMKYHTTRPAVVVQRTSNRDQIRRLNAAAIPAKFREQYMSGFVAENHVIVIEATSQRPVVTPRKLARLINSEIVNERFSTVCGSFSVSAKLLRCLSLPRPSSILALKAQAYEVELRNLFVDIEEVLVLDAPRNQEDTVDQAGNLSSSCSVDKDTGFKRRAIA